MEKKEERNDIGVYQQEDKIEKAEGKERGKKEGVMKGVKTE